MGGVYSPGWAGEQGACSKQTTGGAGEVTKQKPDLAASVPFWEVGLVPRDEGTSGAVEKTSLPGADMIKWSWSLIKIEGQTCLATMKLVTMEDMKWDEERRTAVPSNSQEIITAEKNS